MDWETKSRLKREQRDKAVQAWGLSTTGLLEPGRTNVKYLPLESELLTDEQIHITETIPSLILKNVAERTWTAEQVLRAFISRTVIAHELANPLTEVFFESGLKRARQLDKILASTGRVVGPLHGLPISLKDVLHVAGVESTLGYVAWIGQPQPRNDSLVDFLLKAGAVFYCKTNVPQTLMSGECVNYIFGRTPTPWNISLSAGGSSGGEGALVALGGSPLGVGSDIAGSIRTPANFNGIYGLCPTTGRLPLHRADRTAGDTLIRAVAGPMSRTLDGLEVYTKAILSMEPWQRDPQILRMPWVQSLYDEGLGLKHKLCFGFMAHDQVVLPNPPIIRCMQEVRQALTKTGHQVIEIEPFNGVELESLAIRILNATGGKDVREVIAKSGEPLIREIVLPSTGEALSAWEYKQCAKELAIIRQKYLDLVLNTEHLTESGQPIDAIILPSGGTVASPHGTMEYLLYEAISNVLDWTCATLPVGFVNPCLDPKPSHFTPLSDYDLRNFETYSPERYKDAPVCLQVMGLRHCEEKVLGLLRTIDKALGRTEHHKT
ncbi:putative fatty-acid amide hydrolase [Dactylonectria macrodidyma]|uniref:amidase n=1 Tax=Dactylonectria macrodidyma TaxID=307937 RepID=A0A9P9DXY4_9HYPO|nr:putative fatty-acid amide hydrolase [Dactylonectria macrodidyma]